MIKYPHVCCTILLFALFFAVPAQGANITYTYDNAGQLTKADYGGGKNIAYAYDAGGNMLRRQSIGDAATYTLTVNSGTGGGEYEAGTVVAISANAPAAGKVFDQWTGDTGPVADVNSATTNVTMPAANVAVTAAYGDQPIVYVSETGCGNLKPCYATLNEAVMDVESDTLVKVAGDLSTQTNVDAAKTLYIEFGYDANFTGNDGGVTRIQGSFTAKDKTIIRSGTIRVR